MEFFQEMAISHGSHFSPAYMHTGMHVMQEHSANIDAGAPINVFPARSHHNFNGGLLLSPHHHHQLAEGMDERASNPHLHHIDSPNANSLGLCTHNSTKLQFCEVSCTGSASATHLPCKIQRRSWQEALSSPLIHPKFDIFTRTQIHLDMHQVECSSVDPILNLYHIQAGATNHSTDPNYSKPKTLLTHKMPLEESLIAVYEKGIPAANPNGRSFLSALNEGDEAFFKQQLLVPMEGLCKDDIVKQGDTVLNDHEEPNSSIKQLWGHQQSTSAVTDPSSRPSKNISNKNIGSSCTAPANMSKSSKNNDEIIRASQDSTHSCSWEINASRGSKEDIMTRHIVNGGSTQNAAVTPHLEVLDSRKRSLADHDSAAYMTHSKRAHLGSHGRHSSDNMMKHSGSSTSLNMSDNNVVMSGTYKSNATSNSYPSKTNAKSSVRNPRGPALNTNLKPRARQGTANDPQTLAARNRRERINARIKVLQELVPNGSKVDLVTMLEKAINYVKFLQLQLRVLSNDEFWQANELEKVAMQHVLSMDVEEDMCNNSCTTTNNIFIDQP